MLAQKKLKSLAPSDNCQLHCYGLTDSRGFSCPMQGLKILGLPGQGKCSSRVLQTQLLRLQGPTPAVLQ